MAKTISKQSIKRKKVVFKFLSPNAKSVSLVGNFNNWDKTRHPMQNDGNGLWSKTVMLHQGSHQYKFLADNNWVQDPDNGNLAPNEFGTLNNVIDVA
jgi:1,4-alpha-glucan branching enzyme